MREQDQHTSQTQPLHQTKSQIHTHPTATPEAHTHRRGPMNEQHIRSKKKDKQEKPTLVHNVAILKAQES